MVLVTFIYIIFHMVTKIKGILSDFPTKWGVLQKKRIIFKKSLQIVDRCAMMNLNYAVLRLQKETSHEKAGRI